jgi:hypothetical protein
MSEKSNVEKKEFPKVRTIFDSSSPMKFTQDLSRTTEDQYALNEDGVPEVVGSHDIYQDIQSYKDDVDIYKLIEKFDSGDLLALNQAGEGVYGDTTKIPTNPIEGHKLTAEAIQNWTQLPAGLRKLFDDDIDKFIASDAATLNAKINEYANSLTPKKVEEPKKEGE